MPCGHPNACTFEQSHQAWVSGDFEAFMAGFAEDILWTVNIDGIGVPYASSAVGKEDLRWRLTHMMETFEIAGFDIEAMEHGEETCRSLVQICYVHRTTREPLMVKLRFKGWQQADVIVRMEESTDAPYVEAYNRFVRYLEAAAQTPPVASPSPCGCNS